MRKRRKLKDKKQVKIVKQKAIRLIEPEAILEKEIAQEDRDLQRAKVAEILMGFRKDREKRKEHYFLALISKYPFLYKKLSHLHHYKKYLLICHL